MTCGQAIFDYLGISMYSGIAIAAILGFLFPIFLMGKKKATSWKVPTRSSFAKSTATYNRVTSMDGVSTINLSASGVGARKPTTVMARFQECVERAPNAAALKYQDEHDAWQQLTWTAYLAVVRRAAKALMHLGLERFGCVSIIGFNSPEWLIADLAAIAAGGAAAGPVSMLQSERAASPHFLQPRPWSHSSLLAEWLATGSTRRTARRRACT